MSSPKEENARETVVDSSIPENPRVELCEGGVEDGPSELKKQRGTSVFYRHIILEVRGKAAPNPTTPKRAPSPQRRLL